MFFQKLSSTREKTVIVGCFNFSIYLLSPFNCVAASLVPRGGDRLKGIRWSYERIIMDPGGVAPAISSLYSLKRQ